MWLRSLVMIAATVFTATVQSQPADLWVLSGHKQIKGPSERATPNCNWRGDSGDRGARFHMSCTFTTVNVTAVTAGAVSWEPPIGFERLRQGDEVPLAGVVDNASSPKVGPSVPCSLRWNAAIIAKGAIAECFLSHTDEMWSLDMRDRINDHAMVRIERVVAMSRTA